MTVHALHTAPDPPGGQRGEEMVIRKRLYEIILACLYYNSQPFYLLTEIKISKPEATSLVLVLSLRSIGL